MATQPQEKIINGDEQRAIGTQLLSRRTREQLCGTDGGAIAHAERLVRHVPRVAEVSLIRD